MNNEVIFIFRVEPKDFSSHSAACRKSLYNLSRHNRGYLACLTDRLKQFDSLPAINLYPSLYQSITEGVKHKYKEPEQDSAL